jgi:hypothetical protein
MSVRHYTDWADQRLPDLYDALDEIAGGYPSGSTERGLIRDAMNKLELADKYVEKREAAE